MPDWLQQHLAGTPDWLFINRTAWFVAAATYVLGLLTKPLQEEIARRLKLRAEVRRIRRNLYKELLGTSD